jgi:hypothetical protein
LFLKCKEAKQVWEMLKVGDIRDRMCTLEHAGDFIQEILKLNDEHKILCCCLLWRNWLLRSKINAEGQIQSLPKLISQVKYFLSVRNYPAFYV